MGRGGWGSPDPSATKTAVEVASGALITAVSFANPQMAARAPGAAAITCAAIRGAPARKRDWMPSTTDMVRGAVEGVTDCVGEENFVEVGEEEKSWGRIKGGRTMGEAAAAA